MSEILIILSPGAGSEQRRAIAQVAAPTQSISDRVWVAHCSPPLLAKLLLMPGIDHVLTGSDATVILPGLNDAEALFAEDWVSGRGPKQAAHRQRPGLRHSADDAA